jgi:DNA-binding transcriptional LysR family regulator
MMVYDAETAMAVTAATDMVTLVPRRYAEACPSSARIRIIDFPRDHAEMIELSMLWHSRVDDDPGSLWLRTLIRDAVKLHLDEAGSMVSPGSNGISGTARLTTGACPSSARTTVTEG